VCVCVCVCVYVFSQSQCAVEVTAHRCSRLSFDCVWCAGVALRRIAHCCLWRAFDVFVFARAYLLGACGVQAWPSARSSVPKEIADAKEEACAMCTVTDTTVG